MGALDTHIQFPKKWFVGMVRLPLPYPYIGMAERKLNVKHHEGETRG